MKGKIEFHENFSPRDEIKRGSDFAFGITIAFVLAIIGGIRLWAGDPWFWAWGAGAMLFLVCSLGAPGLLGPLNRLWFRLGLLLHRIVNPIIMAFLFFLIITPNGLLMRMFGKDVLRLKLRPFEETYWIERDPGGPPPESMKNQF